MLDLIEVEQNHKVDTDNYLRDDMASSNISEKSLQTEVKTGNKNSEGSSNKEHR